MTPQEFDACFDEFTSTAWRLETRQRYIAPGEEARIEAFRQGMPRPERSVRTEPFLARIAVTTVAGKEWCRVRLVTEPLTEYTRYQMAGFVESQAAGWETRIAVLRDESRLGRLHREFWLFDAYLPGAFALLLDYDDDGRYLDTRKVTDRAELMELCTEWELAVAHSVPFNEYVAERRRAAA